MHRETVAADPAAWVRELIERFVAESPANRLKMSGGERAFDPPLVGFAGGGDPIWREYAAHIGDFYLTPAEIYRRAFPKSPPADASELTVVSWILPSTAATRSEQERRQRHPSERWARTRLYGEDFNDALRRQVVSRLDQTGIDAVAPMLAPFWSRSDQGPYAPCSNWSERHAAYAAGLGTFGLCDGLITPVGKAMRTGSVLARLAIEPSARPYTDRHEYCLFYRHGNCGKCIPRCPVEALSTAGHDKQRCMQYTEVGMNKVMLSAYGLDTYACGLCQTGVPCMDHIPGPEEG